MKNTLQIFLLIAFFQLFFSCNDSNLLKQIEVINDAFLSVVDTIAYRELSLRPPPPNLLKKNNNEILRNDKLTILISDTLFSFSNKIWGSAPGIFCKDHNADDILPLKEVKEYICNELAEGNSSRNFNISKIKESGRYILVKSGSLPKTDNIIVGKVQFSQIAFDNSETMAVFFALIWDPQKSGIEKLFILSKKEGRWEVVQSKIFAIY